jgi:hypothetical protein
VCCVLYVPTVEEMLPEARTLVSMVRGEHASLKAGRARCWAPKVLGGGWGHVGVERGRGWRMEMLPEARKLVMVRRCARCAAVCMVVVHHSAQLQAGTYRGAARLLLLYALCRYLCCASPCTCACIHLVHES